MTDTTSSVQATVNAAATATAWLAALDAALAARDFDAVDDLFVADAWWRDLLALDWDFQARHGHAEITSLLAARVVPSGIADLRLREGSSPRLVEPDGQTGWIEGF